MFVQIPALATATNEVTTKNRIELIVMTTGFLRTLNNEHEEFESRQQKQCVTMNSDFTRLSLSELSVPF